MFVGGLSLYTDEEDLKAHFVQYGPVMHAGLILQFQEMRAPVINSVFQFL